MNWIGRYASTATLLVATACAGGGAPATLPPDMLRLGEIRLATADEARGAISAEAAVAAATAQYGRQGAQAYLVVPNNPQASQRFDDPVNRSLTWIVRWDDMNFDRPGPPGANGVSRSMTPLDYLYVSIDPFTGEVLNAAMME